ncbi:hypothetical protein ACFVYP_38415, partial [Kitasatospora sp. NPDC058201]|uniref:hypothetical protein n=1 Tax=unclassified Kitasatospora TaxID=2633591 RepID=UPI0036498432
PPQSTPLIRPISRPGQQTGTGTISRKATTPLPPVKITNSIQKLIQNLDSPVAETARRTADPRLRGDDVLLTGGLVYSTG